MRDQIVKIFRLVLGKCKSHPPIFFFFFWPLQSLNYKLHDIKYTQFYNWQNTIEIILYNTDLLKKQIKEVMKEVKCFKHP